MSDVVLLLQIDHRNVIKLLDLIEQQTTNMARRDPVNYSLLESIFDYLSSYPGQCHHPKEDLLYRKLQSRHPGITGSLEDLLEEHQMLACSTRNLMRAIGPSRRDTPAPEERLRDQLVEYLGLYRRHMLMEDLHFFPAALKFLSRDDFAEIDFTLFDKPDPLYDPQAEARFAELRDEIARQAAVEATSHTQHAEAALLATFQDIAAFNGAMQRSGEPVRLTGSSVEGYELAHRGKVLVHIPSCSEARAAWCAYFYWKASAPGQAPLDQRQDPGYLHPPLAAYTDTPRPAADRP